MGTKTWCPQCGLGVKIDEDGCCKTCGATATGEGVDQILMLHRSLKALLGVQTREELAGMEAGIRITPAPEEDKISALNALYALRICGLG